MADHSKPNASDLYTDWPSQLDARFDDLALGLDPATTSPINLPTNAIRWSSASAKWQKYNGSTWSDLATTYAISIGGNAATATKSTNLANGAAGSLPYQSGANATAMLAAGTSGYILKCNGAAAPSWVDPATLTAGNISGIAAIANGGTGASTAANARTNLGAAASGAIGSSGLTIETARLAGRWTAGTGAVESVSIGTGLSLAAGVLSCTVTGGVTTFNGRSGAVTLAASDVATHLNASGSAPMFACRAWVNFNGTGIVSVRASGNVSSITDHGVGDYTIKFITPMPDASYAILSGSDKVVAGDGSTTIATYSLDSVPTTIGFRCFTGHSNINSARDNPYNQLAVVR